MMRIMCLFFSFRKCLRHERYHIDKEVMAYKTSVLRRIDIYMLQQAGSCVFETKSIFTQP